MVWSCDCCPERFEDYKKFLKHLRAAHEGEPGFHVDCAHCHKTFNNIRSYKRHTDWHNFKQTRDSEPAQVNCPEENPPCFLERHEPTKSSVDVADFVLYLQSKSVPKKYALMWYHS